MHAKLRILLNIKAGSNEKMPHRDMFLSKKHGACLFEIASKYLCSKGSNIIYETTPMFKLKSAFAK